MKTLCLEFLGNGSLLVTTWSEWAGCRRSDGESKVLSPGQAVELDVLIVDFVIGVGLDERKTTETWVRWVGNAGHTVKLPLPDNSAAVVHNVDCDNILSTWLAESVINVDSAVGLNNGSKLKIRSAFKCPQPIGEALQQRGINLQVRISMS